MHMARYYWADNLIAEHNKYVMALAMSENVLFNAMMAKTLTEFRCGGGLLANDLIPGESFEETTQLAAADFSYYKMRTMQCLQVCLHDQTRVQLQTAAVLAIVFMIKDEVMGGSVQGIELHLSAFRRLIRLGVNLDYMSPAARSPSLFAINAACAVVRQVPPLVPPTCADNDVPEKISSAMREVNASALMDLCRGFNEPGVMQSLGPKILCYISWQRDFVLFKELALAGHLEASVQDYGAISSMMHRADYHLLCLPYLHQLTPLQEAIRLSLLIADITIIIGFRSKTLLIKSLASQLKKAMQLAVCTVSDLEDSSVSKLLFWSCFIGAHMSTGLKERPWFLMQLIKNMRTLGIDTQQATREIVLSFLYTDGLFSKAFESIWEEMEELSEDLGFNDSPVT